MNAEQLFNESKYIPIKGQDQATAEFTVVKTVGYDGFDVTVFRGTFRVGHYGGYDSYYRNENVDQSEYLQVANTISYTTPEILREAIKRCDLWFKECENRIAIVGQGKGG